MIRPKHELLIGDVMDVLPTLEADSFDAMLTDPPYGLEFMGKEWDGRVPSPDVWRECLRVLKPGAFALVFGGTRTFHRLAVALEDAGFELRDTLMWVHSQGFPKSHDISKGIDKLAGAERKVIGSNPNHRAVSGVNYEGIYAGGNTGAAHITAPATPEAERWQGYGTALKPAYEPILLVRKPTRLTYAKNALEHGTGALNIDGARVPFSGEADEAESKHKNRHADFGSAPRENRVYGEDARSRAEGGNYDPPGRWPANLIHDGSDEVVDLFPSTTSRGHTPARRGKGGLSTSGHSGQEGVAEAHFDTGSAARFFYAAKASSREREAGLDDLPEQLFAQSGGAQAALARGESEYQGVDASTGLNRVKKRRNPHPTVKPLALTEYLARLLLPPERDTPRRLLVPFAGSGSEMIGAGRAGWDEVIGIEREAEYVAIAEQRLAHWLEAA